MRRKKTRAALVQCRGKELIQCKHRERERERGEIIVLNINANTTIFSIYRSSKYSSEYSVQCEVCTM